jgi:DNA invertase Pin-like site-specific DNA recombinase
MEIGYARVSCGDHQDFAAQLAALTAAGCDLIFREEASGGQANRPELALAIGALKPGDVLVVWKLDRLSRSLRSSVHPGGNRRGWCRFLVTDRGGGYNDSCREVDDADLGGVR